MDSSPSMWTLFDGALRHELVSYLDEDDVYRLWVFAEEQRLDSVRDYITRDFDGFIVSPTRARQIAMGYACWTAVCRLTDEPASPGFSHETMEGIRHQLHQHVVPLHPHPDRDRAMATAAGIRSVPQYVMYFAARQGKLESVIWLHTVARYDPAEALRAAAYHGHDHVIIWLLDNLSTAQTNPSFGSVESVFRYEDDPALGVMWWRVTYRGYLSYVLAYTKKWGAVYATHRPFLAHDAICLPIMDGDLESVQRMLKHDVLNVRFPESLLLEAADAGHLHVFQWLYDYCIGRCSGDDKHFFVKQACPSSTDMPCSTDELTSHIRWLSGMLNQVMRKGHIQLVRWLFDTFPEGMQHSYITSSCYYSLGIAYKRGYLETVQYFLEMCELPVTPKLLSSAAESGHQQLFKWLHERLPRTTDGAFQWDTQWLDKAARSGDLQSVQWLVEDCGLWSLSALASATSLDVAEYLHSYALLHDKPHDLCVLNYTAAPDDSAIEVLIWQLRHGLKFREFEKRIHLIAADEDSFARTQQCLGWAPPIYSTTRQYTPAMMARLRELVRVFIDVYDPESVRKVEWLPKWAMQHGTIATLRRLKAIGHQQPYSSRIFGRLLHRTKSAAKVQWLLTTYPWVFSLRLVRWAVRHDQRRFLVWLCREYLPSRQTVATNADAKEVVSRCVRHALRLAQVHGRVEIAAWAATQL